MVTLMTATYVSSIKDDTQQFISLGNGSKSGKTGQLRVISFRYGARFFIIETELKMRHVIAAVRAVYGTDLTGRFLNGLTRFYRVRNSAGLNGGTRTNAGKNADFPGSSL